MRVLLVAAEAREFQGILAVLGGTRETAVRVDWARVGRLNGYEALLVANGAGWQRAAAAVDAACSGFAAERVVSTGFCGALDPALTVAEVVVGACVSGPNARWGALPVTPARPVRTGTVCSLPHVARTAEEKRALHAAGASIVEMEAAGVAERAAARGLGFSCVRAVTDLAGETLDNDFNRALRADGHFDTMRILGGAVRHPVTRFPELIRLQRRSTAAARALGEFFADCRF